MSKLLKNSAIFSCMTLLSRMLGLVRDVVIANYFSVAHTDVFFTALRIPNTLRRFFAEGGFANAFVPVLNETKETRSDTELQSLINHVFGVLGSILLLITVVGITGSSVILGYIGFGFAADEAVFALGDSMLKITFPYILCISLTAFFAGILNAYNKFALPAFIPALLNVALIVGALYFREYCDPPVLVLAWSVLIGGIVQLCVQLPTLWKLKRLPRPRFSLKHAGVVRILRLMVPTLLGSSAGQINILLNTALASSLTTGSITWLYYSDRLMELPVALIGVALGIVILPRLSALKARADDQQYNHTLSWAVQVAVLVGSAAATGLYCLSEPLMITMLYRGEFSLYSAQMASKSLSVLAVAGFFLVLIKILAPGFYSRHNTKTPAMIAICCIGVNIIVALLLYKTLGHVGLATATALSAGVNCVMLASILYRQTILVVNKAFLVLCTKVVLANIMMAAALIMSNSIIVEVQAWHEMHQWMRVGVLLSVIVVALMCYVVVLTLLRVPLLSFIRPSYD